MRRACFGSEWGSVCGWRSEPREPGRVSGAVMGARPVFTGGRVFGGACAEQV